MRACVRVCVRVNMHNYIHVYISARTNLVHLYTSAFERGHWPYVTASVAVSRR